MTKKKATPAGKSKGKTAKKKSVRLVKKKGSSKPKAQKKTTSTPPDKQEENRRQGSKNKGQFKPGESGNNKTQWKPGQSGNPNGRPPARKTYADGLRDLFDQPATSHPEIVSIAAEVNFDCKTATVRDVFVYCSVINSMRSKSSSYLQEVVNRLDGKVTESAALSSPEETVDKVREFLRFIDTDGRPPKEDSQ